MLYHYNLRYKRPKPVPAWQCFCTQSQLNKDMVGQSGAEELKCSAQSPDLCPDLWLNQYWTVLQASSPDISAQLHLRLTEHKFHTTKSRGKSSQRSGALKSDGVNLKWDAWQAFVIVRVSKHFWSYSAFSFLFTNHLWNTHELTVKLCIHAGPKMRYKKRQHNWF